MITDAGLSIAVRAARGCILNQRLADSIDLIMAKLMERDDNFGISGAGAKEICFYNFFPDFQKSLGSSLTEHLLAKGEVHGKSGPLWASKNILLQGTGFNYDFADEVGPARDLRTGIPYGKTTTEKQFHFLK